MPALHEHSQSVLIRQIDPDNIEIEIATWIDYYRNEFGAVRHVWCSKKDRPQPWTCTTSDGLTWNVEPKGAVPQGHIFVH